MESTHNRPNPRVEGGIKEGVKGRIENQLLAHSKSFNFYQAVKLLQQLALQNGKTLKLTPKLSQAFPGADIDSIIEHESHYELVATFLGLYSTDSPLPSYYIDDLLKQVEHDNLTLKSFLDIFHQRLYELLFAAWAKYQLAYQILEKQNTQILRIIYNLAGLSTNEVTPLLKQYPEFTQYARFFMKGNRTLLNLQSLLADCFATTTMIHSYHPVPILIHQEQLNQLGITQHRLGHTLYLGKLFRSVNSNILIELDVASLPLAFGFTPQGAYMKKLKALLKVYLSKPLNCFLRLRLHNDVLSPCALGQQATLGQTACLGVPLSGQLTSITYALYTESVSNFGIFKSLLPKLGEG